MNKIETTRAEAAMQYLANFGIKNATVTRVTKDTVRLHVGSNGWKLCDMMDKFVIGEAYNKRRPTDMSAMHSTHLQIIDKFNAIFNQPLHSKNPQRQQ